MHPFNSTYTKLLLLCIFVAGHAFADDDPMWPMYEMTLPEPKTDLSARPLAGKFVRYAYHSFWEVNKNKGVRGAPAEMMHDIFFYKVSWLEPESKQVVTQIINLNLWTINTSFHFNNGKGLALWQGVIYLFGEHPISPVTVPEKYWISIVITKSLSFITDP